MLSALCPVTLKMSECIYRSFFWKTSLLHCFVICFSHLLSVFSCSSVLFNILFFVVYLFFLFNILKGRGIPGLTVLILDSCIPPFFCHFLSGFFSRKPVSLCASGCLHAAFGGVCRGYPAVPLVSRRGLSAFSSPVSRCLTCASLPLGPVSALATM